MDLKIPSGGYTDSFCVSQAILEIALYTDVYLQLPLCTPMYIVMNFIYLVQQK